MVKMINLYTGVIMEVHESRVKKYLEAGHALASDSATKAEATKKPQRRKKKEA